MGILANLLGLGANKAKLKEMIDNGAVIIDVRTPAEYKSGHVRGSKNIPLQNITSRVNEIKKMKKPVILCCASGARSGQAKSYLRGQGVECENGGGWTNVNSVVRG